MGPQALASPPALQCPQGIVVKAAFHDTDTDILTTIVARMSVSVSWNAVFTPLIAGLVTVRRRTAMDRFSLDSQLTDAEFFLPKNQKS